MLAQITLPAKWSYAPVTVKFVSSAKWSYAPVTVKFVSYAPAPTEHPLYLRGGAVSLPSKAERLASSPSKRGPLWGR